jgi:hemerythrin-like metal-binding protein
MTLLTGTEGVSVGVRALDEDRSHLVELVNKFYDAMQAGRGKHALGTILSDLGDDTHGHFAREEKLLAQTRFPDAAVHKQQHDLVTSPGSRYQETVRGRDVVGADAGSHGVLQELADQAHPGQRPEIP